MSEPGEIADLALSILGELGVPGEVYLEERISSCLSVSGGDVERLEMNEERGAGIRVLESGRIGFAHTSDLSAAALRAAAASARALARHADGDPHHRLPGGSPAGAPGVESADPGVAGMETYRKAALARAMEEAARGVDGRITRVREALYEDLVGRIEIRNTAGLSRGSEYTRIYGTIDVIAEEGGSTQAGFASDFAVRFSGLDPFRIGREAGHRAIAKLGATRPPSGRADIVFDPSAAGELLAAFAPAFYGTRVLKGRSFLAGRIGRAVASEQVTLVDDGRFPGADGCFPFDAEGVESVRSVLVERGVLRSLLHNTWSAGKMGVAPTGNAVRTSYMAPPAVGASVLYLEPSTLPPERILNMVPEGYRITELMGLHTVDPITGEFSLGAAGQRIRAGRVEQAVAGIGLAGSIAGFLGNVAAVGADLRLLPGPTAGSTTLVRGLAVSGL